MKKYKKLFPIVSACVVLTFSMIVLYAPLALANTSLTVSPVTSPSSPGHVGQNIVLSGVDFQPNATVTITYSTTPVTIATTRSDASGNFAIDFDAPQSPAGVHTINASDGVNSFQVLFYMEAQAPPIPQTISPETGAMTAPLVRFDWKNVRDESGVTYTLCVATKMSFVSDSIVLQKTGITDSEYKLSEAEALACRSDEQPYYWRVKAVDGAYNESGWSGAGEFYIGGSITVDPVSGTVGTEISVEGERYAPNEDLEVTYDDDAVEIEDGDNETDSSGTFALTIIVPESIAGNHTITVTGDDGSEVEAAFVVESEMTLNPVTARPGDIVTIAGTGFGRSVDVDITLGDFGFVTDTGHDGSFDYQFEVPDLDEAIWDIDAEDDDGNDATVQLTVDEAISDSFVTSNLAVSPTEVEPGEEVAITIEVTNTGDIEGDYLLRLLIDEALEEAREVTLAPDMTETVIFTITRDDTGTYLVDVNGLTRSFTVTDITSAPSAPAPEQTPTPGPNWAILGPVLVAVFLAIFLPIRLRKGKL